MTIKSRTISIKDETFIFEDKSELNVPNVVWATGFKSNYQWLQIPNALQENGQPEHIKGITKIKGLYFLGLPWQTRRGSALLQGVADDAKYIAQHIQVTKQK